jgi:hypothetical protein
MAQRSVFEKKLGLFVASIICYKYADLAINYLLKKPERGGHPWSALQADSLGSVAGLVCLGLFTLVSEVVLLRKLGYRQLWPLPFISATIIGAFVILWQRQMDSRIAFAVYFLPILILLFVRKRGAGGPPLTSQ